MKYIKRFNENLNEYPNEIIANKTLYQDVETFVWSDEFLEIGRCESIYEPANSSKLKDSYEDYNGDKILVYYEYENDGSLASIFDIELNNLKDLISNNLISIV